MDTLPVELLSRIMTHVVFPRPEDPSAIDSLPPFYQEDDYHDYWSEFWLPVWRTRPQTHGPLQLTMVSRLWKTVSESTPELWTRIAVHIGESDRQALPAIMLDLSKRLSRSGALPFDLRVVRRISFSPNDSVIESVLDELYRHSDRFLSASYHIPAEMLSRLGYHHHASPQLTHFLIRNSRGTIGLDHHDVSKLWPSLARLTLSVMHFGSLSLGPSNVLTHLELVCVTVPLPWKSIQDAKLLTHLTIQRCEIFGGSPALSGNEGSVHLPGVVCLDYEPALFAQDSDLLRVFVLPSLKDFDMVDDTDEPGFFIDSLASTTFLSSCANSLRRLVLSATQGLMESHPSCEILITTLTMLSSLEHLALGFTNMPLSSLSPLLKRLAKEDGTEDADPHFLPKLRCIQFNAIHGLFWPWIPAMFRQTGPDSPHKRPLRQLIVKDMMPIYAEGLTVDVMDQLAILLEDGIDIQFYDKDGEMMNLRESLVRGVA